MLKKLGQVLAFSTIAAGAGIAHATPLTWTFGELENLEGSFVFDDATDTFSDVSFFAFEPFDDYFSAMGDAGSMSATSDFFGDQLELVFLTDLTALGGLVNYTGSISCEPDPLFCPAAFTPFNFVGTVSAPVSSVPVPATVALIGMGLAGLGWRRRQTA